MESSWKSLWKQHNQEEAVKWEKPEELLEFTVDATGKVSPPSKAMKLIRTWEAHGDELVEFSIFNSKDPERDLILDKIFKSGFSSVEEDRAVGSVLGMPIGDALGAPLEFKGVRYGVRLINGFDHTRSSGFGLKPGQWTDDSSMGLCLADSLISCKGFNPADLKHRFVLWWNFGYCNAFRFDKDRYSRHSVGLGGNISMSFSEFYRNGAPYTTAGDKDTSGNGSIMRMSPVPVYYHDIAEAVNIARLQSLTTHQGEEARECSALMAWIIVNAIHNGDGTKKILDTIHNFQSDVKSINFLIRSQQEDATPGRNWDLADRDWNWKDPEHKYSPERSRRQPGYVGSYAMDALCMALHCIWTTDNFADALLKAANMCGDADSVASVTGQLAGAIYGVSGIPKDWVRQVQQWDGGDIALRAYKLFHHTKL